MTQSRGSLSAAAFSATQGRCGGQKVLDGVRGGGGDGRGVNVGLYLKWLLCHILLGLGDSLLRLLGLLLCCLSR